MSKKRIKSLQKLFTIYFGDTESLKKLYQTFFDDIPKIKEREVENG